MEISGYLISFHQFIYYYTTCNSEALFLNHIFRKKSQVLRFKERIFYSCVQKASEGMKGLDSFSVAKLDPLRVLSLHLIGELVLSYSKWFSQIIIAFIKCPRDNFNGYS